MSFMEPLLALQEIDAQILELQREIKDIPARKAAEKMRLDNTRRNLTSAENELRSRKSEAEDFALQASAQQERAAKLKHQQETLKTAKALKAMADQLAASDNAASDIVDAQIGALDAIPDAEERVLSARTKLAEETEALNDYIVDLDERLQEAQARLAELEVERCAAAKLVGIQQLRVYDRLRISRTPTIVKLTNGVCGGCHLAQPPSIAHLIRRNDALVSCQMCGRLLY